MEGHQLDSESDIRNKLKKKHIRKRTCDRVLTDAITNELKRLSELNDGSVSTQYKHENYLAKNYRDICINNFKNCLAVHQNVIPRKIIVYVPKAKNDAASEYLCNMFLSYQKEIFRVNSHLGHENDNSSALMLPQHRSQRYSDIRYRDDEWCTCSGIDISRLFIFAKIMYETSQQLRNLANDSTTEDSQNYNNFTISIELENLRKLLNPMPGYDGVLRRNQSYPSQDVGYNKDIHKPFTKFDAHEKSIKFKISIEKHSMRFNITTCKINVLSRDFLQALETFLSVSKTATSYDASCNVPSLSVRNWHFHNIGQGYLLNIVLRNINVNTLNTMRKLYFVIITCSNSNLMIEIIIKLKSGIFMVYDSSFYQEVINWNKPHHLFINKSVSMATLENAIQKRYIHMHNRERQLNVITDDIVKVTKSQQSNPNILRQRDYHLIAENEDSYLDDYYSDSETLHTMTSDTSVIILPQRNGTTLILQPDETAEENNRMQAHVTSGDSIINNILMDNSNIYNANFLHSKQWLNKLVSNNNYATPKEKSQIRNITEILKFNSLKESIFDRASIQRYLETVTDLYWKEITSQSFYMIFIKSLGQSIAKILFSAVI
ncbi:hypothetical protein ABMA27_011802 [Loxostege sticticalis]|uniref:Uncharacterized protein n=1 Tax=Loxostege sticticalis TaxID=481309 RepID=A0ABR3IHK6_LOXSC